MLFLHLKVFQMSSKGESNVQCHKLYVSGIRHEHTEDIIKVRTFVF